MTGAAMPFRVRLRIRYGECDAQGIVFNARWGDYVDVAIGELCRLLFADLPVIDFRLRKQTLEWFAPARPDEVIELAVRVAAIGTTSFTIATEIRRGDVHLASAETLYVVVDNAANEKRPVPPAMRAALERGAPGTLVDQSGTIVRG
jgi:acyl-CoA thioester hydrolase